MTKVSAKPALFLRTTRKTVEVGLEKRIEAGRLKRAEKIYEALGRLKERYPRVARYWLMNYEQDPPKLGWHEDSDKKQRTIGLDGTYLLKTDRR